MNFKHGKCSYGAELEALWFIENGYNSNYVKTDRTRRSVSNLVCPNCLRNYSTDNDYLAGPWI